MDLFGHVTIFQLLLEQAAIAETKLAELCEAKGVENDPVAIRAKAEDDAEFRFYQGKLDCASFFCGYVMPQVGAIEKMVQSGERSALDIVF